MPRLYEFFKTKISTLSCTSLWQKLGSYPLRNMASIWTLPCIGTVQWLLQLTKFCTQISIVGLLSTQEHHGNKRLETFRNAHVICIFLSRGQNLSRRLLLPIKPLPSHCKASIYGIMVQLFNQFFIMHSCGNPNSLLG